MNFRGAFFSPRFKASLNLKADPNYILNIKSEASEK